MGRDAMMGEVEDRDPDKQGNIQLSTSNIEGRRAGIH
jgi:hypothetical protein